MLPHDPRRNRDIILVFAHPDSADARLATEAGVDHVGNESLFEPLQNGEIKPTKILCVPSLLPSVTAKLGRFLGQRGLMPTARRGGVGEGEELVQRIREARGMTDWMTDNKGGIIACECLIKPNELLADLPPCCIVCGRVSREIDWSLGQILITSSITAASYS